MFGNEERKYVATPQWSAWLMLRFILFQFGILFVGYHATQAFNYHPQTAFLAGILYLVFFKFFFNRVLRNWLLGTLARNSEKIHWHYREIVEFKTRKFLQQTYALQLVAFILLIAFTVFIETARFEVGTNIPLIIAVTLFVTTLYIIVAVGGPFFPSFVTDIHTLLASYYNSLQKDGSPVAHAES